MGRSDDEGEIQYVRDEHSGAFWSPYNENTKNNPISVHRAEKQCLSLFVTLATDKDETVTLEEESNYCIPRGTTCLLYLYELHRDPAVFPNPEVFDPDRFSVENSHSRNPFAYIPFSAGPRNCIGQKYAQLLVKVIIIRVLRKYTLVSLDPRDRILVGSELVLRPKVPLRMKILPRR
ncbi:cytochrome P450 4c3-like [Centruroides vittatus]|uniref:cytochrome P450 4c3-like n=1 Tax=Centruroides vittatus TaxID=120091 RepID=UPI00350FC19C